MPPRKRVLRLLGSPYIATPNGEGWDIMHEESMVLVAWVRGNRKDAMNELSAVTAKAKLIAEGKDN